MMLANKLEGPYKEVSVSRYQIGVCLVFCRVVDNVISNMLNNLFMIFRKLNPQKNIYCGYCGGLVSVY